MTPPTRLLPGAVAGVLGLAVLAGLWLWPPARVPVVAASAAEDTWRLEPPRPAIDVDRAAVSASLAWARTAAGGPALPVQEEALTPPDWRISGVYANGAQSAIIISVPGKPDQTLGLGATLPGGARIVAISPERTCIVLNGKRLSLGNHRE